MTFLRTRSLICLTGFIGLSMASFSLHAQTTYGARSSQIDNAIEQKQPISSPEQAYVNIIIEFDMPSMANMVTEFKSKNNAMPSHEIQRAYTKKLKKYQRTMLSQLSGYDIDHIRNFTASLNGAKCRVHKDEIKKIEAIEGVKAVRSIGTYTVNQNIRSSPRRSNSIQPFSFLGGQALHDAGYTGKGVTIAIIDEGVNYLLEGLGGNIPSSNFNSNVQVFRSFNNPEIIEPGTFPNSKVIGGIDLAGTHYDPSISEFSTPMPDPDPIEISSPHGSLAAALSAADTGFNFEPGFAPDAKIIAIKIFGDRPSTTNLVVDGIEYALDPNQDGLLDDAVDIINLSLGADFGTVDNADTRAIETATKLGTLVIAGAGNTANVPFSVNAPSTAASAISVAGSLTQNFDRIPNLTISNQNVSKRIPTFFLQPSTSSFNAQLIIPPQFDSCEQIDQNYSGKVIMVREECFSISTQGSNRLDTESPASSDGARFVTSLRQSQPDAVLIITKTDHPQRDFLSLRNGFRLVDNAPEVEALLVGKFHGQMILNELKKGIPVQLTLDGTQLFPNNSFINVPSSVSGRGPTSSNNQLKPEISAPGFDIDFIGSDFSASGTSFATPIVSGIAAALLEKFPDASPAQIKALILNSAQPMQIVSEPGAPLAPLTIQGLGLARADTAAKLTSFAMPAALSLGVIEVEKPTFIRQEVTLTNTTDSFQNYTVSVEPNRTVAGLAYRVQRHVGVPANAKRTVQFGIQARPDAMASINKNEIPIDGWIHIENADQTLRVGYFGIVKPRSNISVRSSGEQTVLLNRSKIPGNAYRYTNVPELFSFVTEDGSTSAAIPKIGYRTLRTPQGAFLEFAFVNETTHVLPFRTNININYEVNVFIGRNNFFKSFIVGDTSRLNEQNFSNHPTVRVNNGVFNNDATLNVFNNSNWHSVRFPIDEEFLSGEAEIIFSGITSDFEIDFSSEPERFHLSDSQASGPVNNPGIRKVSTPLPTKGFWLYPNNSNNQRTEDIEPKRISD